MASDNISMLDNFMQFAVLLFVGGGSIFLSFISFRELSVIGVLYSLFSGIIGFSVNFDGLMIPVVFNLLCKLEL